MALTRTRFKDTVLDATDILDSSYLVADADQGASTFLYEKITGNILKKVIIAMQKDARALQNVGLSASVASNALTIDFKQNDGSTDPTSTHKNKSVIAFRSSTLTSGAQSVVEVTSALSLVVPSGATLGTVSTFEAALYIYAINNAGTVELAISASPWDEARLVSTTVMDTASDSAHAIYSTTARSNVACRLIGKIYITETTAGTWATAPTVLQCGLVNPIDKVQVATTAWVKRYPDGTMEQWVQVAFSDDVNNASGGIFVSPSKVLGNWPVAFTALQHHQRYYGSTSNNVEWMVVNTTSPSTTVMGTVEVADSATATSVTGTFYVYGMGTWR